MGGGKGGNGGACVDIRGKCNSRGGGGGQVCAVQCAQAPPAHRVLHNASRGGRGQGDGCPIEGQPQKQAQDLAKQITVAIDAITDTAVKGGCRG